mmetsp:Transcript_351/g.874  ORF Transcript_351/g.874 Transcript_351/m.874 type:complete len:259 (-) Transcript_351:70-846(-)
MLHVRMCTSPSRRLGMSGWRAPWSNTRPRIRRVSSSNLCFMCITSTMYKSMGSSGLRMYSTASVTMSVRRSAIFSLSFVLKLVRATMRRVSLSVAFTGCFSFSKNEMTAAFATSKPSTRTRGWVPSPRYRSAAFMSSPIMSTMDVVPSPVTSSCATDVRAIMTAVGFWICISRSSTFPSLVSLMAPAPSTSILMVPLGPRLVFMTSCSPLAALMFMNSAAARPICSALALSCLTADILAVLFFLLVLSQLSQHQGKKH